MSTTRLLIVLVCFLACTVAQTFIAISYNCYDQICLSMALDLVTVDVRGGKEVAILDNIYGWDDPGRVQNLTVTTVYDTASSTFFAGFGDPFNQTGFLLIYDVTSGTSKRVPLPYNHNGQNLTNIEYDPKTDALIGNFGPCLVSIDYTTGDITDLGNLWDPTNPLFEFGDTDVGAWDVELRRYYADGYSGMNTTWNECLYIYTADLSTSTSKFYTSPCIPQQGGVITDDDSLLFFAPYTKSGHLVSLWVSSYGTDILDLEPLSGNTTVILDYMYFNNLEWDVDTIGYDMYTIDSNYNLWMSMANVTSNIREFASVNPVYKNSLSYGPYGDLLDMYTNFELISAPAPPSKQLIQIQA